MKNYISIITLILFLSNCNPKEEIAPENPCDSVNVSNFDFTVEDDLMKKYNYEGHQFTSDSIYRNNETYFTSKYNYTTYEWRIIGDPNWKKTTKSFSIRFANPGLVNMMLIGKRTPNTLCLPNDDGIDTITKELTVLDSAIIYGKYYGYEVSNPTKPYTFEVRYSKLPISSSKLGYIIYFPDSCKDFILLGSGVCATSSGNLIQLTFINPQGGGCLLCKRPNGWAVFNSDGVDIKYKILKDSSDIKTAYEQHFIGKRIK